ncbi:MAG TPA: DUF3656 domain-containing protein [Polyangiaceae bacterium]|nr:DUF3656 domain-containing protein [Polyangiaceae bacterium]
MSVRRPELLAPAGDEASLNAAVAAGADAVYFGLKSYSARARAENFDQAALDATMRELHRRGRKGYVALNTLVFDAELGPLEASIRACAEAGVDAVIVQDLGVARLVRSVAPSLPIHASTQMTCTDAGAVELARELGASRVILARELSLEDIARVRAGSDLELEVFVHGALCVAYSGQCLTSEAIGGRSANRGACAQACRLPYELMVDGERRDTGDRAYLLSPQDLEASALVPRLVELGVASLKIEGRLKGPDYVFATTRLYREAIDGAAPDAVHLAEALQTFSRGSGPGFLGGTDHQRLVDGETCDHRGVLAGTVRGVRDLGGRRMLDVAVTDTLRRGDGVLVQGGYAGEGEVGGRVWTMRDERGLDVETAKPGSRVYAWLGPDRELPRELPERRLFRTSSPSVGQGLEAAGREPARVAIDVVVAGTAGAPLSLHAIAADGRAASAESDVVLAPAKSAPLTADAIEGKLAKLGETSYELRALDARGLADGVILPLSSLNRARRALTAALDERAARRHETTQVRSSDLVDRAAPPDRAPPPEGLFVLARNLPQAQAALDAGASGVYLDFLELVGTGAALRALRERPGGAWIGVAPPRIRKPGEEKIDRYLRDLRPDAILVRGLGALREAAECDVPCVGDFSLNVTNRLSAAEVLGRGVIAFTPSFDLDEGQLRALVDSPFGPFAEVVVHHPMPLFHMEHCVFAAMLSNGSDHRTCGRPCESHTVSLRDRAGVDHPIEADVGCRNTVFHGRAQSAVGLVPALGAAGVRRHRIELVRETPGDVAELVATYAGVLSGASEPGAAWRSLRARAGDGYGVVRGSLRVIA